MPFTISWRESARNRRWFPFMRFPLLSRLCFSVWPFCLWIYSKRKTSWRWRNCSRKWKNSKKYEKDPQLLAQKQSQLYKEAQFNPLSGCLPMLVQFPVLLAFYRIFMFPTKFAFTNPEFYASIQKNFFLFKTSIRWTLRGWFSHYRSLFYLAVHLHRAKEQQGPVYGAIGANDAHHVYDDAHYDLCFREKDGGGFGLVLDRR